MNKQCRVVVDEDMLPKVMADNFRYMKNEFYSKLSSVIDTFETVIDIDEKYETALEQIDEVRKYLVIIDQRLGESQDIVVDLLGKTIDQTIEY